MCSEEEGVLGGSQIFSCLLLGFVKGGALEYLPVTVVVGGALEYLLVTDWCWVELWGICYCELW